MHFRPYPVLTIIAIPALVALLWLGVWQVNQSRAKAGLIESFQLASAATPLDPNAALCGSTSALRKVIAPPVVELGAKAIRVWGHNAAGDAGWRRFQLFVLRCGGAGVLAETGFEPEVLAAPGVPNEAVATRFMVEAWPGKPWMAAGNAPDRNEWHWFDALMMGAALDASPLDARYVLTPVTGVPDYLTRTTPEGHIGYAVTWFGMAIAFLLIYGVFHARAGRLRFGKGKAAE